MNGHGDNNGNGNGDGGFSGVEWDYIRRHHRHELADNQCSSALVKHIKAPVHLVWSLVRRFDQPQKYKPFVSRCVAQGNLEIGSLREVDVKSGLPATTSTERLELLDDEEHILSIRIVGGDHRLRNYSSIISLHPEIIDGRPGTLVIESFVVDVPEGNTKDETCYFVEALIKDIVEARAAKDEASEAFETRRLWRQTGNMFVDSGAAVRLLAGTAVMLLRRNCSHFVIITICPRFMTHSTFPPT
nr:abscisic acid receptor pyl8 [Quercus suber]